MLQVSSQLNSNVSALSAFNNTVSMAVTEPLSLGNVSVPMLLSEPEPFVWCLADSSLCTLTTVHWRFSLTQFSTEILHHNLAKL